jgi:hypothetical protein
MGLVKSSTPIAIAIGPAWQRLNVAASVVTASTHCYCDICVKIWRILLPFIKRDCQQNLLHQIFPPSAIACQWTHMCQRTCIASERRTGWSRKLLDIFDRAILMWLYKMVDMKYSRWGGTKVLVRWKWSSVATGAVSHSPIATVTLSSNDLIEVINAHCYYDWARLVATEHSNRRGDGISPLLVWPSSTSHGKIYDINNKVS